MKGCTLSSRKILSSREDMRENLKEGTEDIKLTKLSSCGGCGAKVGAGVLAKILEDIKVNGDPNLLVVREIMRLPRARDSYYREFSRYCSRWF